ncbi:MAG: DUF1190 domain-containing protein [Beijerinckiaceae bacterium]|nr:DUF1190 domain-containing protein [Beijerinckiaceae bacterium]
MKIIVFALILGIAGAMAFFAFRGECPDGQVFASEQACLAAGQLPPALCRQGFAEAQRAAREDQAPFATQDECLRQFPRCQPHGAVASGFVPVPRGACIAASGKGRPVYQRIGSGSEPRGS